MFALILGLIVFFGIHSVPMMPARRARCVERLGLAGWRGLFSAVAFVGLGLIVYGMAHAPYVPVWPPTALTQQIARLFVPLAFVLVVAAYVPCNLKRITPHPMLWGVELWAAVHLLANGDLAGILLFGSFLIFAVVDRRSLDRRGARVAVEHKPWWMDGAVIVLGLCAAAVIAHFHGALFGVPVV